MSIGSFKKPLDPRKLAAQRALVKGSIDCDMLPRFRDAVFSDFESIQCELEFDTDADGHALVFGRLQGLVQLQCQRCLEAVEHRIETEFTVRPVLTDAQAEAHQKTADIVMLNDEGQLDAVSCIEDELLLALPIVVYHDYQCLEVMQFGDTVEEPPTETKENPFAILASLNRPNKEE